MNPVTIHLKIPRGGRLILDGNPTGYEVAEHTATKVEVNPWITSTPKKKIHLKHESREGFETSVVGPLGVLVALVKRQTGHVSSKSGGGFWETLDGTFFAIRFSLLIDTRAKR